MLLLNEKGFTKVTTLLGGYYAWRQAGGETAHGEAGTTTVPVSTATPQPAPTPRTKQNTPMEVPSAKNDPKLRPRSATRTRRPAKRTP